MEEDQHENDAQHREEDRSFHHRDFQNGDDKRLRWAQVIVSAADAIARLADFASRFVR
jgi:hypothetical protein